MNVATKDCDVQLAKAINSVVELFNTDKAYSIGSRKKSPFTLIKKLVDNRFKELVKKHKDHHSYAVFSKFVPSEIGQPNFHEPHFELHKRKSKYLQADNDYFKKFYCLEITDYDLKLLCRRDLPGDIYHAFDSFRYLISTIRSRKPAISNIDHSPYCKLCWRKTQQQQKRENGISPLQNNQKLSYKYCDEHSLGNKKAAPNKAKIEDKQEYEKLSKEYQEYKRKWGNYIKDRKTQKDFTSEALAINNMLYSFENHKKKSKFSSIYKWCCTQNNYITPNHQEERKLAYDLVRSRVNSTKRLIVLELYLAGHSTNNIISKSGRKAPSVYRDIQILKEDIPKIIRNIYLNKKTGNTACPYEIYKEEKNQFDNESLLNKSLSLNQEIENIMNIPPISLEKIRDDLKKNSKKPSTSGV